MKFMEVASIKSRQILDSRGNPTVETDVVLSDGSFGRSSVPSGVSTGVHEAVELRDNDEKLFSGKSVYKAVENVNQEISSALSGMDAFDQKQIDQKMVELDATSNKERLGANAILSVSLAIAHAAAASKKIPLFEHVANLSGNSAEIFRLPLPMINVINGGKHANWGADIQEFMILPVGGNTFSQSLQIGSEIFHKLSNVLKDNGHNTTVGDEGGYAPILKNGNSEAFDLITKAVKDAGYQIGGDVLFGIDVAASEIFKDNTYTLKSDQKSFSIDEMIPFWEDFIKKYNIASIEDPLDQEDWTGWQKLTSDTGRNTQIVGDDLFATNTNFLQKGIELSAANAILIKVNQIGTLSETIDVVKMAHKAGWNTIISHRSGETEDTTIAHLAVGIGSGQIKTGSVSRSERVAKYNELLRIEEILGSRAEFHPKDLFPVRNIS